MEISVIIPVYNAAAFVEKAVESALQFEEVKEVILIEDGSPDNALDICMELERKHLRVKLFQHPDKKNHGAGASRNLGIQNATCPFIAFLDADDFYLPNRFEADKRVFEENHDADGVYNAIGVHYYSEEAKKEYEKAKLPKLSGPLNPFPPNEMFSAILGFHGSFGHLNLDGLTIKNEIRAKLPYWFAEELRLHQDSEFIIRLTYYGNLHHGNLEEPVAVRGVHDQNRITAVRNDIQKTRKNQKLFWTKLNAWAKNEVSPGIEKDYIKREKAKYCIIGSSYLKAWTLFFWHTFPDKELFFKAKYYDPIHLFLWGDGKVGMFLLKAKYKIQKMLKIKN